MRGETEQLFGWLFGFVGLGTRATVPPTTYVDDRVCTSWKVLFKVYYRGLELLQLISK